MSLAKSSMGIAERYLELVDDDALGRARVRRAPRRARPARATPCSRSSSRDELLDRHPVLQQSIRLRNPYVDPMNAIQVELLKRSAGRRRERARPLLRSIAGIAAALRNTG